MNSLIKPNKLNAGDTIAAITLSWSRAAMVLPYGCRMQIETDSKALTILESGVV